MLTSATDWCEWSAWRAGRFTPEENSSLVGGPVGNKGDLDGVAKRKSPCPCRESELGRPPRSVVTILTENAGSYELFMKVKLSLCLTKHHPMKTYWGSRGIAPRILDIGTRWRWVVSFTPWPLYPQGKSLLYPLDRRLGEPQSRSGRGGEEKNSLPTAGNRTLEPQSSSPQPSAIPTELYRNKHKQIELRCK
jgi:hypothetical protein